MSVLDHVSLPPGAEPENCIKEGFDVLQRILDEDINPTAGDVIAAFQNVLGVTDVTGYSSEEFSEVLSKRIADVAEDLDACHVLGLLVNLGVAAVIVERDRRKETSMVKGIKEQFQDAMDKLEQKLRSRGN